MGFGKPFKGVLGESRLGHETQECELGRKKFAVLGVWRFCGYCGGVLCLLEELISCDAASSTKGKVLGSWRVFRGSLIFDLGVLFIEREGKT